MILFTSHHGRARLAVVTDSEEGQAILSTVTAAVLEQDGGPYIRFGGAGTFEMQTREHVESTIGKMVRQVHRSLALTGGVIEINLANIGAASQHEIGLTVSGYSGDVSVFLAALCALLDLPSPMSVLATGHIASPAGEIANVRGIPAKVAAARLDRDITSFVCPSQEQDGSIGALTPDYQRRSVLALDEARSSLKIIEVLDVAELTERLFDPDELVRSALLKGYFEEDLKDSAATSPIERLIDFLRRDGRLRFWSALERSFQAGQMDRARELLYYYCTLHLQRRIYPSHFGRRLFALLTAQAPAIRRFRIPFPVLSLETYLRLAQFGDSSQQEDARLLFRATQQGVPDLKAVEIAMAGESAGGAESIANQTIDVVLAEISAENIANKIGRPIDEARAAFVLESVQSESNEATLDIIASFYLHLQRAVFEVPVHVSPSALVGEVKALVGGIAELEGGMDGLYAEARDATRGGLRFLCDRLADEYKRQRQLSHVNAVLEQSLGPLKWNDRVLFIRELMLRLTPLLPEELHSLPAERLARNHKELVNRLVASFDSFKRLLRTL